MAREFRDGVKKEARHGRGEAGREEALALAGGEEELHWLWLARFSD